MREKEKWKLSESQKREIVSRYKNGELLKKIALDYGISQQGVCKIVFVRGCERRRKLIRAV